MSDARWASPFADLLTALHSRERDAAETANGSELRLDPGRARRTGIPEIVHAENKDAATVAAALGALATANGRALASRVSPDAVAAIEQALAGVVQVEWRPAPKAILAVKDGAPCPRRGGKVGVLSAGTSDVPIASEAALIAEEMGAAVLVGWDVGVAGLHRLVAPLERFAAAEVDVIIVAAGMDGALPSVVAGLVDVPVIGLPTSVGYGIGGGGVGALMTMLQSCAPGLVVVNIDNGIGAGSTAALIANRAARLRRGVG